MHRCIPEPLAIPLTLAQLERREVGLEDGHRRFVPYIWRVEVRFGNRRCFTGAMVWAQEVLLGGDPDGGHGPGVAAPAAKLGGDPASLQ